MRIWRISLSTSLTLSCILVSINCSADSFIVGENRDANINPGHARREMMQVDGRAVECWVARSPGAKSREPQAYVLFFFGNGGRVEQWIDMTAGQWGDKPVEMWGMNYPGSGGSEGPVSAGRVGPDALALYDRVKTLAGQRPIFIEAASFGTAVGLCVASQRPVAGLMLRNPPPMRELILEGYGWWNLGVLAGPIAQAVPVDLDSIANGARCTAPAIFIMAGSDTKVPPRFQQRVVDAYAGPKRIVAMPGATHDSGLTPEAQREVVAGREWMWESDELLRH